MTPPMDGSRPGDGHGGKGPAPRPPPQREDLPSISVRRPVLALVMNLLIIIGGVAAVLGVEVRELPSVERPIVTIRATFPGAAPETMDAEVTRVLEGAAARVQGVHRITSSSEENNARVRLSFNPSVDINVAANDVREAVASASRRLPDGVEEVVVVKANDEADPIMRLSVRGDGLSTEALTNVVEDDIVPRILAVPGVADVQIFGTQRKTLTVVVDPRRLASHRLSVADVATAMESASLDVPSGSFESAGQDLIVRANATVVEEHRIERIVIRGTTRIGDVASVFYGPEEATSHVRLDGSPVLGLGVVRQAQSNTIEISAGVDQAIAELNRTLSGTEIVKTSDDAVFIRGSISEVLLTLGLGTVIVVLIILVFIGSPRLTLIPAVTIPVALIGTVAAIWLLGFSINILTLLALVLATGLVVDDAIVVLENIERTRRAGVAPMAAAVLGTRQVFFAVIATTVTLASVFVPIAFLPGQTGQLFTEFGLVLAIAVCISSFVALSLCPMLAARLIGPVSARRSGRLRRAFLVIGGGGGRFYDRTLSGAMHAPLLVVAVGLGLLAGAGMLYGTLDQELVPREDRGQITIALTGPDGVNLDYTDRQVKRAEAFLEPLVASGEATGVFSIVGRWDLNRGSIVVPLAPWGERRSQAAIVRELQPKLETIPGARVRIVNPNSLGIRSAGTDLEFALAGPDYTRIAAAGDGLIAAMTERLPRMRDPVMDFSTTQPQLSVEIDRERAADLGVDLSGVARTLQAMVDGTEVTELNVEDESVPIRIQSAFGAVNDTDDLRNLHVAAADGRTVPLSSLVRLEESAVAGELDRHRQRRAIEFDSALAPGYALDQAVADLRRVAGEVLPSGVNVILLGQAEALEETGYDVMITFAIALVVVLLVLAAQFESFVSAVVIMLTVPFGLAAAVLALWLTGTSLNIYSQIGLIMLVGMMAKNGILIVEFANQLRDQGMAVREAAYRAAVVRLRPVMMTVLSTTLAAVPLILSTGPGAEARVSIGWVVFGGLGIAILATLYVTPVLYQLLAPLSRSRGDFGRALDAELARAPGDGTAPDEAAQAAGHARG